MLLDGENEKVIPCYCPLGDRFIGIFSGFKEYECWSYVKKHCFPSHVCNRNFLTRKELKNHCLYMDDWVHRLVALYLTEVYKSKPIETNHKTDNNVMYPYQYKENNVPTSTDFVAVHKTVSG